MMGINTETTKKSMDYLDELHGEKPDHIDIFVDASRLRDAKSGGWGAHIVETYKDGRVNEWTASEGAQGNSVDLELKAAMSGLQAVQERLDQLPGDAPNPSITLYSDQKYLSTGTALPKKEHTQSLIKELKAYARAMGADIQYGRDSAGKYATHYKPEMRNAHNAAQIESYTEKLKRKGHVHLGNQDITRDEDKSARQQILQAMGKAPPERDL